MVAQVSAMLISLRQHVATMRGRSLYDNTFTILTAPGQLSHTSDCLNTQQAFIPSDIPPPRVKIPATKGVGKEIHFVCVRACVHSTACVSHKSRQRGPHISFKRGNITDWVCEPVGFDFKSCTT